MGGARKVRLDFERGHSAGWAAMALAVAGALAAAAAVQGYSDATQRVSAWESRVAELRRMSQRSAGALVETSRDPAELRSEIRLANGVLQQMTLPWDGLFRELERSRNKQVALLSVEPDLQNRRVRIGGEAKTLRAAIEYSRRLEATGTLYNVYIVGHETKTRSAERVVSFSLVAGWR